MGRVVETILGKDAGSGCFSSLATGLVSLTPLLQAAARHRCRYLVNLHVLQFLRVGGDPQWLRGLDCIPPKLRKLSEINKILAHQPWLVGKEHIEVMSVSRAGKNWGGGSTPFLHPVRLPGLWVPL